MHQRHSTKKLMSNNKLNQELLLEDDESVLYEVRRHPFGILAIIIGASIVLLLVGVILALAGISISGLSEQSLAVGLIIVISLLAVILTIGAYVYFESRFVITDKHIVQILQIGLFNRKTSQLSLLNVEDVTVEKKGIFATIFDYGILTIETAGEQKNFIFSYCPKPNFYADAVLDARHELIEKQNIKPASPNSIAS